MTPNKISALREMLIAAIDKHLAEGGTLISGKFHQHDPEACCPMYLLSQGQYGDIENVLAKMLDIENIDQLDEDVWTFIYAFDNVKQNAIYLQSPMADLGRELRAKYLTSVEK